MIQIIFRLVEFILINWVARFTAMHLGAQLDGDKVHFCRYAVSLQTIVKHNPHSLLAKFANGMLLPEHLHSSLNPKYFL
jgi:hypothetical protein